MNHSQLATALCAALLSLAVTASTASAQITYVDADTGNQPGSANTTLVTGGTFTPASNGLPATANDMWLERTGFAEGGDVLASAPDSDCPRLRTTITGLTAGTQYDMYVYYWVAIGTGIPVGNNAWDISLGLTQASMVDYAWDGGVQVTTPGQFTSPVLLLEGNRALFEVALGTAVASATGTVDIFIDDVPGNMFRTWYDGAGYAVAGGSLGTPFCAVNANSIGLMGSLGASSSITASDNDLTFLGASLIPNQFGIMINSLVMGFTGNVGTNGSGNLCLDGDIGRFSRPGEIIQITGAGTFAFAADLTDIPRPSSIATIMSGETWYFQFWHRDFANGMPSSNLTNGLEITFQ